MMTKDEKTLKTWAIKEQTRKAEILGEYEKLSASTLDLIRYAENIASELTANDTGWYYQFIRSIEKTKQLIEG